MCARVRQHEKYWRQREKEGRSWGEREPERQLTGRKGAGAIFDVSRHPVVTWSKGGGGGGGGGGRGRGVTKQECGGGGNGGMRGATQKQTRRNGFY